MGNLVRFLEDMDLVKRWVSRGPNMGPAEVLKVYAATERLLVEGSGLASDTSVRAQIFLVRDVMPGRMVRLVQEYAGQSRRKEADLPHIQGVVDVLVAGVRAEEAPSGWRVHAGHVLNAVGHISDLHTPAVYGLVFAMVGDDEGAAQVLFDLYGITPRKKPRVPDDQLSSTEETTGATEPDGDAEDPHLERTVTKFDNDGNPIP